MVRWAKSRSGELDRLAHEQRTYRRRASLVARGASPSELFAEFADELGPLLPGDRIAVGRCLDGTIEPLAAWGKTSGPIAGAAGPVLDAVSPGALARIASGGDPEAAGSHVVAAIHVEGRPWGLLVAAADGQTPLPVDARARLVEFAELIGTVIANAQSRAALLASRARIVAAFDQARRRLERDLHDGAQQRLVSLTLELRAAQASVPPELSQLNAELSHIADEMTGLLEELRTMARGIHPAVLDSGGLAPALRTLARRAPIPVRLRVEAGSRQPEGTEVAAYYVVSEALANVAKHARASEVHVDVRERDGALHVTVSDDGIGGADAGRGTGLVGLTDRVEALGGSIAVHSPPGAGTTVHVELPLQESVAAPFVE